MKWLRFRWLRLTGQIPWWWECDRRLLPSWSDLSGAYLVQAKREGLY